MRILTVIFIFILTSIRGNAQVAINADGSSPHASAVLDISSTTKGVLIPRMTQAQREMINSPAPGLLIYQTDNTPGLFVNAGSGWNTVPSSVQVWCMNGNAGTDPSTQFLGTSDNQPIRLRLNNIWAGEINRVTNNIFIGDSTGIVGTGNYNTCFGHKSLSFNTTGYSNTGFGHGTLRKNTTGAFNTAMGTSALGSNTTGTYNTAIGLASLLKNTTGSYNVSVGNYCMNNNTIGTYNTALGYEALRDNVNGISNTAVGASALAKSNAFNNTAVGSSAMYENLTGEWNTAIGSQAMRLNAYGVRNTAVGYTALYSIQNGYDNTAIGYQALQYNNSTNNTAIGAYALQYNTSYSNTAVGNGTLFNTTSGPNNAALGFYSMLNNTTGGYNTAIGTESLKFNTYGSYNVSVGAFSGTYQGFNYYNTVSIGNNGFLNGLDNQAFLGNLSTTWNGGNVGWGTYSDARVKTNIREEVKGLDFIKRLRPVTYYRDIDLQVAMTGNEYKEDFPHKYDIEQIKFSGFLAQEVLAAAQESEYDFSGVTIPQSEHELYTLRYETFVVPLVKAVQEQQVIIDDLKSTNAQQLQLIMNLEARLIEVEKKVN